MTFADWTVLRCPGDPNGFFGGDDGNHVVNSVLSSPLTLQGQDCRDFTAAGVGGGPGGAGAARTLYVPDDVAHPSLHDIPDTRQIRVSAYLRCVNTTQPYQSAAAAVGVKCGAWYAATKQAPGYWWGVDSTGNAVFHAIDAVGVVHQAASYGGYATNLWHGLRMEVVPVVTGGSVDRDEVTCFANTGTEATPIWTQIHQIVITNVMAGWIPWGHVTYNSLGFRVANEVGQSGAPATVYIDSFDAKLKAR